MTTIAPPNNRNLVGTRQGLTWISGTSPAIIDGWPANFSDTSPRMITIAVGAPIQTQRNIALNEMDATPESIVSRINSTLDFPGLASVVSWTNPATSAVMKRIRLIDQDYVRVVSTNAFTKIGLPVENRGAPMGIVSPISTVRPSIIWMPDRNAEFTSSTVDIPNHVNRLSLWLSVKGNDPANNWGVKFVPLWSNGTDGETINAGNLGTSATVGIATSANAGLGSNATFATSLLTGESKTLVGSTYGQALIRHIELAVPVGATRFRLLVARSALDNEVNEFDGSAGGTPPLSPPEVRCSVCMGVRS